MNVIAPKGDTRWLIVLRAPAEHPLDVAAIERLQGAVRRVDKPRGPDAEIKSFQSVCPTRGAYSEKVRKVLKTLNRPLDSIGRIRFFAHRRSCLLFGVQF